MNKSYLTHISLSIFVLLALAFLVSSATAYETSAACVNCHGSFTSGTYSSLAAAKGVNPAWPGTLHDVHRNLSASNPPGMLNGNCNACHIGSSRTPVYTYKSNGTAPFNLSCSGCHDGPGLRAHHFNSGADNTCYDCHTSDPTPDPENVLRPVYTATFGTASGTTGVNDPCNPTAAGFEGRLGDVTTIGLDNDGNLLYDQDDPACKPAAAPVLSVSPPTPLAFGSQNVGTTSPSQTVTLTNTGNAVLTVNSVSNSNSTDFSITTPTAPFNIAAGANQTFTVAFKPETTGGKSATISISSNGGSGSVSATGTGATAPAPVLSLSPTTLAFGNQDVGTTSQSQTVKLSNTGNAPLNVTSSASSSAEFKFSPATMPAIGAGGSATLSVTFVPASIGAKIATISVTSDGGSGSVSVTGTGTTPSVTVPNVVGMTQAAAGTAITGAGLTVGTVTTQSSAAVPAGNVISQNPAAGASVASGSAVNLVVSSGPPPVGGYDVGLVNLTVPEQVAARVGRSSEVDIRAYATTTAREAKAMVTLTADPVAGVSVSIDQVRVSEEIKASEDHPEKFEFGARIVCTQRGTWPINWTAKISSAQNSDPANDTLRGTTQVVCTNTSERRGPHD